MDIELIDRNQSIVYVDDGPIHGKGLFAGHPVKAGEVIAIIDGIRASPNGEHVLWLDGIKMPPITTPWKCAH